MALKLVTGPAVEPLTLDQVKAHLRVTQDREDALIGALIVAARERVELVTGRALITQTWDWILDGFPFDCRPLDLPKGTLQTLVSINYADGIGTTTLWPADQYQVDDSNQARLSPAYGLDWPCARCQMNAVTIRLAVGYGDAPEAVPQSIQTAMLLMIGWWYENREDNADTPVVCDRLLQPYRLFDL